MLETADTGTSVPTGRRPLALLAVLATAGARGLSRDKVTALFCPERDTERGRNSLSQVISALRRDLGAEDLVVGTSEIRLNPNVIASDVAEFELSLEHFVNAPSLRRKVVDAWNLHWVIRRLGELHEAGGDTADAVKYYEMFAELWNNADPSSSPRSRKPSRASPDSRRTEDRPPNVLLRLQAIHGSGCAGMAAARVQQSMGVRQQHSSQGRRDASDLLRPSRRCNES